jgi:hypothetical protein
MTSYNSINGTLSPVDTYTRNELPQRTSGFGGCRSVYAASEAYLALGG